MKCFVISILYFTVISFLNTSKALDVYHFVDTRAYSMGNSLSALPGFANPAGYVFTDVRTASIQYMNRYGIKELSTYAGTFNFSNKYLNVGAYISRYGFRSYHETLFSLNIYRKLSSYIGLGIRANYMNLHHSERESNKSLLTADIGLSAQPLKNLVLSVLAVNPFCINLKIDERKMEVPVILSVGASYRLSDSFLVVAEVEKDFAYSVLGKLGMEYNPIKQLNIRIGVYGKPFTPSFGVGVRLSSFTLDLAFNRHPVLGFCSCCGLSFNY